MTAPLSTAAIGAAVVIALMFVLWLVHLLLRNASIVDVGWASGLGILAVVYAIRAEGDAVRAWVMASMGALWGLRLAVHLLMRIIGHPEEGRYVQLRREWKTCVGLKFLAFFQLQALLCVVLSTVFLFPTLNPEPALSFVEVVAVALWALAIGGESLADAQLRRFKADPSNSGMTCRDGLWKYSRHPNYFFEWLIWVSFAVFSSASAWGWLGWLSPALILLFLFKVTGIPATEAQAIRSRGEEYRRYQKATNAFFPWFPRGNQ